MRILDGVAPLADRYDGFILDLWGVVHDGAAPYPGVTDALARLRAAGRRVCFLSNAPRRSWTVARQLARMGVDEGLYDGIVTSGELVWRHLRDRGHPFFAALSGDAFHLGPERDRSVAEDLPVALVDDPAAAGFVLNTGPDPDRGGRDCAPYEPVLRALAARSLPMVCANPDRAVMVGAERLICAGALADRYRALGGGPVIEIGKPDPAAYPPVLDALGLSDRSRVVAIGDSPHTDLAGAQAAGIDAVWALTGLAGDAHGPDPDPAALAAVVAAEGLRPVVALKGLRW